MPQKLLEDKIGKLSHSGGVINLSGSLLSIGGQQYSTIPLSRTISSDVSLSANTRYQIYAVLVSGTVALRISANENSVGPTGFTAWELVGSFYANGLSSVGFGSFVNIKGAPQSNMIDSGPMVIGAVTSAPTKATTMIRDRVITQVNGATAKLRYEYRIDSAAGAASGSGQYLYSLPSGLSFDTNFAQVLATGTEVNTMPAQFYWGSGVFNIDATSHSQGLYIVPFDSTRFRIISSNNSATFQTNSSAWVPLTQANTGWEVEFEVPIQGWSNTPIEDL